MMTTCEVLATTQQPILMVGESASGKSSFMKDFINTQIYTYAKEVSTEHITCSYHLDSSLFKDYIERYLESKKPEKPKTLDNTASKLTVSSSKKLPFATHNSSVNLIANISPALDAARSDANFTALTSGTSLENLSKKLRPPGKETKLIVYLEDLHLSKSDTHMD